MAAQIGKRAGCIHGDIAVHVRLPHRTGQIINAVEGAVTLDRAAQVIRRRGGKRDAGKIVKLGKRLATRYDVAAPLIEMEWMGDLAVDDGMGGTSLDIGLEGIGLALVHMDQRPAHDRSDEFVGVESAVTIYLNDAALT